MLRRWMPLLICSLFLIILGCSNLKVSEVSSIRIECVDICNREDPQAEPFTEKTFSDPDETSEFINAINKASQMNGMLNYTTYFLMHVTYPEREAAEKVYVLNIANVKDEGTTGLLVDTIDSEQGFEIQPEFHEELRKLIYGE